MFEGGAISSASLGLAKPISERSIRGLTIMERPLMAQSGRSWSGIEGLPWSTGPPPQSALALSLRCGRSRSTRSARLAGYLRGQVINSGEEQLENRRGVCLVVTEDQINRWRFTLQRTAGYGPGKKITWVGGQQRYGAGRRDHGHSMGNVVHLVNRKDIQAGSLQVVLDHNARGRGRLR